MSYVYSSCTYTNNGEEFTDSFFGLPKHSATGKHDLTHLKLLANLIYAKLNYAFMLYKFVLPCLNLMFFTTSLILKIMANIPLANSSFFEYAVAS